MEQIINLFKHYYKEFLKITDKCNEKENVYCKNFKELNSNERKKLRKEIKILKHHYDVSYGKYLGLEQTLYELDFNKTNISDFQHEVLYDLYPENYSNR